MVNSLALKYLFESKGNYFCRRLNGSKEDALRNRSKSSLDDIEDDATLCAPFVLISDCHRSISAGPSPAPAPAAAAPAASSGLSPYEEYMASR